MKKLTLQLLSLAEVLHEPEFWGKGREARTVENQACCPHCERAVCWCLQGAARALMGIGEYEDFALVVNALHTQAIQDTARGAVSFNDDPATRHADVIELIHRTAARVEAEPLRTEMV